MLPNESFSSNALLSYTSVGMHPGGTGQTLPSMAVIEATAVLISNSAQCLRSFWSTNVTFISTDNDHRHQKHCVVLQRQCIALHCHQLQRRQDAQESEAGGPKTQ